MKIYIIILLLILSIGCRKYTNLPEIPLIDNYYELISKEWRYSTPLYFTKITIKIKNSYDINSITLVNIDLSINHKVAKKDSVITIEEKDLFIIPRGNEYFCKIILNDGMLLTSDKFIMK